MTPTTAHKFSRISATHYQYISDSKGRQGWIYELIYHEKSKRWLCNCGDAKINRNEACKHRIGLVSLIRQLELADEAKAAKVDAVSLPSLSAVLAALPAGARVSAGVVPFAGVVSGAGAPVPVPAFSAPAALLSFGARVCAFPCSCGGDEACTCPSLAVVLAGGGAASCILVWLPGAPVPGDLGPALPAVVKASASSSGLVSLF